MIPDAATIARRRHWCMMIVRCVVVASGAVAVWGFAKETIVLVSMLVQENASASGLRAAMYRAAEPGAAMILAGALALFEKRIVRWIVPYAAREEGCPRCGYSLKNLKSPICPECGADVK